MEVLRDAIRMGRAEAKADYIKHETENRQDAIRMGRAEAKTVKNVNTLQAYDAIRMGRAEAKFQFDHGHPESPPDAIRMGRAEAKLADWVAVAQDRGCNPHGTC